LAIEFVQVSVVDRPCYAFFQMVFASFLTLQEAGKQAVEIKAFYIEVNFITTHQILCCNACGFVWA
jgi:hypothetical protein